MGEHRSPRLQDGTSVKSMIGTASTGMRQCEMLGHHPGIAMLRIFADVAHVWQRAIGMRFVEDYVIRTDPCSPERRPLMRPYRRVVQAA